MTSLPFQVTLPFRWVPLRASPSGPVGSRTCGSRRSSDRESFAIFALAYAIGGSGATEDNWVGFLGMVSLLGGLLASFAAFALAVVAKVKHERGRCSGSRCPCSRYSLPSWCSAKPSGGSRGRGRGPLNLDGNIDLAPVHDDAGVGIQRHRQLAFAPPGGPLRRQALRPCARRKRRWRRLWGSRAGPGRPTRPGDIGPEARLGEARTIRPARSLSSRGVGS